MQLQFHHGRDLRHKDAGGHADVATPAAFTAEIKRIGDETKAFATKAIERIGAQERRIKAVEDELVVMTPGGPRSSGGSPDGIGDAVRTALESGNALAELRSRIDRKHLSIAIPAGALHTKAVIVTAPFAIEQRLPGIDTPASRRLTIRGLLTAVPTQATAVAYVNETGFTNNASVVAEGAQKPESALAFEVKTTPVVVLAHWVRASDQVLADAAVLARYIDLRLRYGLSFAEEQQLLFGSGVGGNLRGMMTHATAFVAPFLVTNPNRADVLRQAIAQLGQSNYAATGIVLNDLDWAAIRLLKDADGGYLLGPPSSVGASTLWGVPVVATPAMTAGDFLAGDFNAAATIFDREQARVELSVSDQDNFQKNLVTIRCEERLALVTHDPAALVKGEFPA